MILSLQKLSSMEINRMAQMHILLTCTLLTEDGSQITKSVTQETTLKLSFTHGYWEQELLKLQQSSDVVLLKLRQLLKTLSYATRAWKDSTEFKSQQISKEVSSGDLMEDWLRYLNSEKS